jgi:hypothetical protein
MVGPVYPSQGPSKLPVLEPVKAVLGSKIPVLKAVKAVLDTTFDEAGTSTIEQAFVAPRTQ